MMTGRPKGTGSHDLRYQSPRPPTKRSGLLFIGRALDQEMGSPSRYDVQRVGGRLELRACEAGVGWGVTRPPNGMPRLNIGEENAAIFRLEEGRYPARIAGGAIVADEHAKGDS